MSLVLESLQVQTRPGDSTGLGTTVATIDTTGMKATSPVKLMQDSNVMHDKMPVPVILVAATVSSVVFGPINEGRWQVSGVTEYHQTGSTSGTLTVTVDTGTTAPGAGTAQLTGTISLAAATQQVVQNGTLIATPTVAGPGDRIGILIAGTMTSLAGGGVTIWMKRVA
jgi:hypothetical protein